MKIIVFLYSVCCFSIASDVKSESEARPIWSGKISIDELYADTLEPAGSVFSSAFGSGKPQVAKRSPDFGVWLSITTLPNDSSKPHYLVYGNEVSVYVIATSGDQAKTAALAYLKIWRERKAEGKERLPIILFGGLESDALIRNTTAKDERK